MTTPTPSEYPLSAGVVPELPVVAKQYAERNSFGLDQAGGYHMRHRMAMTSEGLHSKGDIADELGWRDQQIDTAQAIIAAQAAELERLKRERDEAVAEAKEIRARWNDAENEFAALKAKQVADVEAVMRLADALSMANRMYNQGRGTLGEALDAREALRSHLTKDRPSTPQGKETP